MRRAIKTDPLRKLAAKVQALIQFEDELQPHQKRVIRKIQDPNRTGLVVAHGLGSGKTRTAIEAHKALGGDADVVLPASLRGNYEKEVDRWGGDRSKTKIVSQQGVALGKTPLTSKTLIVDEGHHARNAKTKLSDAIKGSTAKKKIILTGTPIYNNPADIATLVNQAAGKPVLREGGAFKTRYLSPGFIGERMGRRLSHVGELKSKLNQYVDYHKGDPSKLPSITSKTIPVELGKHQSALYRASIGKVPRHLKLNQANVDRLKPYLTGPRMVSNTSHAIDPNSHEEPKIDRAYADLKRHLDDAKGKALVYSNYLEHGIHPIQKRLEGDKISHGVFTGREPLKQRNQTVKDYNAGKHRALLVSSSGAEGLDLKGTRLVQILDPHFNNSKIRQVVGRSARMGSHTHLPPEERHVEVRQYIGRPQRRWLPGHSKGVDDLLADTSRRKDETDRQITALLKSKIKPIHMASKITKIQFAKPGEMAKKYLVGTHWTENEDSQNILDAVTRHADPTDDRIETRIEERPNTHRVSVREKPGGQAVSKTVKGTGTRKVKVKVRVPGEGKPQIIKLPGKDWHTDETGKRVETYRDRRMIHDRKTGKLRNVKASDFRDVRGYTEEKKIQIGNQDSERRTLTEQLRGARDMEDVRRIKQDHIKRAEGHIDHGKIPEEMHNIRKALADALRTQRKIIRKTLNETGRYTHPLTGKPDIIKNRAISSKRKQHGEDQPLPGPEDMADRIAKARGNIDAGIKGEKSRSKLMGTRLYNHLHGKVSQSLRGAGTPEDQIAGKAHKLLHDTLSANPGGPASAYRDLQKRHPALAKNKTRMLHGPAPSLDHFEQHYGPLAQHLGATTDQVRGIHERLHALRNPKSRAGTREAVDRIIKRGDAFQGIAKAAKAHETFTPIKGNFLKKVGIGAAVLGGTAAAGYIAKKIKGSRDKKMSSRGHVIQFAPGEQYGKLMRKVHGAGDHLPRAFKDALSLRLAAARNDKSTVSAFKKAMGRTEPTRIIRDAAAVEARAARSGIKAGIIKAHRVDTLPYAQKIASLRGQVRHMQNHQRQVIGEATSEAKSRIAAAESEAAEIKRTHERRTRESVDRVRGEYQEEMGNRNRAHAEKLNRTRSNSRKLIIASGAAGAATGATAGYTAAKPPKPTEFAAKDLALKGAVMAQTSLWRGERAAKRAFLKASSKYRILRPMAKGAGYGMRSPLPGSVEAGAIGGAASHLIDKIPMVKNAKLNGTMRRIDAQGRKAIRMSSKSATIKLGSKPWDKLNPERDSGVSPHDVLTGGVEGGLGVVATDPLLRAARGEGWHNPFKVEGRFSPKHVGKNLAIGAGVGAVATGLIGAGINAAQKRKAAQRQFSAINFRAMQAMPRTAVTQDRYRKHIYEDDQNRAESEYLRSAMAGGALGALSHRHIGGPISRTVLGGAVAGLGIQAATRHYTASTKDQFGDRSYNAKRIDRAPAVLGGISVAGIAGKRGYEKFKAAKPVFEGAVKRGATAAEKINKVAKFFKLSNRNRAINFDWQDKWTGGKKGKINVKRRAADIRQVTKRTTGVLRDVGGVLKGEKAVDARGRPRKREWEKPWVRNALLVGGLGAAVAGGKFIKTVAHGSAGSDLEQLFGKFKNPEKGGGFEGSVADEVFKKKVPAYAKAKEAFAARRKSVGGKIAGDSVVSKVNEWFDKQAAEPVEGDIKQKIRGGEKIIYAGTPEHDKIKAKSGMPSGNEKAKADLEKKKAQDRKLRDAQGGNAYSSRIIPIQFDENTVYDDKWEDWVRNRPGVVKRNRRPKTALERKHVREALYSAGIGIAGGTGYTVGHIIGSRGAGGDVAARVIKKAKGPIEGAFRHRMSSIEDLVEFSERILRR